MLLGSPFRLNDTPAVSTCCLFSEKFFSILAGGLGFTHSASRQARPRVLVLCCGGSHPSCEVCEAWLSALISSLFCDPIQHDSLAVG